MTTAFAPATDQLLITAVKSVGDRKFEISDVTEELRTAAQEWLLAYTGDFDFLLDVRGGLRGRDLGTGQAKGVLNCVRAEVRRALVAAAAQALPVTAGAVDFTQIPSARYAVEHGGEVAYYVLSKLSPTGKRHVSILRSDEQIYVGTILPNGEYRGKHEHLLRAVAGDPEAAARLFGQTIGKCCRCGRTLTDASSREAGIGPECAQKTW